MTCRPFVGSALLSEKTEASCFGMEKTMEFGRFLAKLRKEKGCLQKEVAAYLNVTVATVSNYEKGVHTVSYTHLTLPTIGG